MIAVYKLIWNASSATWAVAHELASAHGKPSGGSNHRAARLARLTSVALLLAGGTSGAAYANVNYGGLQLCDQTAPAWGTSIGNNRTINSIACGGGQYSFWLGNGVNAAGGGTGDTTAAVFGNAAGQLHLVGKSGVFVDGPSTFGGLANFGNNRITNLANGTAATDAVNVRQLNAAVAGATGSDYVKVNPGTGANAGVAVATNSGSVAIGGNASADAGGSDSVGGGGVAIGQGAKAQRSSVAMGANASAQSVAGQATALALGTAANANGAGAAALGANAAATAARALAVGGQAQALAADGSAIGNGASVTAAGINSVALGRGSVAGEANVVSLGTTAAGGQRRIVNLAAGTGATDAVNLGQMSTALATKLDNTNVAFGQPQGSTPVPAKTAFARGGIAVGDGATAGTIYNAAGAIAVGAGSMVTATGGIAIGENAAAGTGAIVPIGAVALGHAAKAFGAQSLALGDGASTATAAVNSVALGAGSIVTQRDAVSVGNATLQRRIVNLAAGTAGTDAVNLDQMNAALADNAGNPLFQADGTAPASAHGTTSIAIGNAADASASASIAVGGGAVSSGAASLAAGSKSVATGDRSVALGTSARAVGSDSVALGDQSFATAANATGIGALANASHANSVALGALSTTDREGSVSVGGTLLHRQITNMAAGTQANDAVNLAQLNANADATARAFGGNSTLLPGGSLSAPTYAFRSASFNNVGDALFNLDDRVYTLEGTAGTGLVTYNDALGRVEVARAEGGDQVDVSGAAGPRRVTGLANGLHDDEAVTIAQLKAAGVLDPASGTILSALTYDDTSLATARLGGSRGTVISNLADGQVAMGGMQAINGGQLFQALTNTASLLGGGASVGLQGVFVAPTYNIQNDTYHDVGHALGALDQKVTEIDKRTAGMAGGAGGGSMGVSTQRVENSGGKVEDRMAAAPPTPPAAPAAVPVPVTTADVAPTGNSFGGGAVADGIGATAVGQNARASADNAVALGEGSVADRVNSVSVGSAGAERQMVNVADGTEATDAVNKRQLDRGVATANTYTDTRFQGLSDSFDVFKGEVDGRLKNMDRRIDRQGAMSSAMLNMATSTAGVHTDNRVGVGVGFQGGESALSLGYQRAISERATITVGGAVSGDDASVGFGAGFGW